MALPLPLTFVKNTLEDLLPFESFNKPIFIIAPPRSGSTFLFDCLIQFRELFHISYEADLFWWKQFPYERLEEPSDYIDANEATRQNVYKYKRAIRSRAVLNKFKLNPGFSILPHLFGKPLKYVDKTIANCFHLDFIDRAFPDAQYIFLLRDPRAVISSMIEGWNHTFKKPQLTTMIGSIANAKIQHWSYPAAPGWKDVVQKNINEICAWSWKQHIKYPLTFFRKNAKNCIQIRYEDLVNDNLSIIKMLSHRFNLNLTKKIENYLQSPHLSCTTISRPDPNKWEKKRKNEIEYILPQIEKISNQIGYYFS